MNASEMIIAFIGNHTEWNVTSQELTRYYLAGGQRVAFRVIKSGQADKVFYLLADHLGSTNVVMQVGGVVENKTYTAWGKDRTGSITKTDRQYTGQINESELGLYFYNARYYDPDLGRFTSADTIVPQPGNPSSFDRYSYVNNNPIRNIDPSGHRACSGWDEYGNCIFEAREKIRFEPSKEDRELVIIDQTFQEGALGTNPNATPSVFTIGPNNNQKNENIQLLYEFIPYLQYATTVIDVSEIMDVIDNSIYPIYKNVKGSLPGGPTIEFLLGAFTQLASDLSNKQMYRSTFEIIARAGAVGFEDAITESLSSLIGIGLAGVGASVGGIVGGVGGYAIGANATTLFMDNIVWEPINSQIEISR